MIEKSKQINNLYEIIELQGGKQATNVKRTFDQILNDSIKNEYDIQKQTILTHPSQRDYYKEIVQFVFKHEGKSLVKDDGGRNESSKYGILASTARQFGYNGELSQMTKADAEKIYKRLWEKSGAEKLPYPLSLIYFDTYVNSPSAAKRILEKSQGDVDTYLDLREQRYNRLAELRPDRFAKYLKGWKNRINNLRALADEYRQQLDVASNSLLISNIGPKVTPLHEAKKPLL